MLYENNSNNLNYRNNKTKKTKMLLFVNEEDQNTLSQNVPLWHIHYFELKAIKKQQIQEEFSDCSFLPKTKA